ncbi:DNA polymerase-3 subunit epsilon [Roseateles sp. YR242]|uniref:DNA polymerase III subunit epsilon n=1 Tax=Roseateles sp. YR242 TaxID=1855305 RepID=UPI0008B7E591|nr:DNA polymerase III subunit epsilon [Roseateles sp. YR242]SEL62917.1 DNA polymerase-3 subunit epsilon [Roseateles sp. YR242]
MRQIFFDTETTGLNPESGDRVVDIGCVEMVNRQLTGRHLHFYLNPERDMPEEAFRVHGLSIDFLSDKPKFAEIVDEMLAFMRDAELIAHNASFDVGFINAELKRAKRPLLHEVVGSVTDTLVMARDMFPGKANSLDALCRRLEVDNSNRGLHGAVKDAELLAEVYIRLTRGQDSLVIDDSSASSGQGGEMAVAAIDLSSFQLPVLAATAEELVLHDKVLAELDKASGGKRIWQQPAVQTAVASAAA